MTGCELHFGQHFEHRGVLEIRARVHGDRLDARATGRIQLLARHGFGERSAHEVVDDLAMHLLAVLLANHRERRLAGTKALEPRGARNLVQPLRHFAVDLRRGNRHFEAAFKSARGGQRNLHINSLSIVNARRVVRKERLELSRVTPLEPKSSASTSSATFAPVPLRSESGHARGARIIAKPAAATYSDAQPWAALSGIWLCFGRSTESRDIRWDRSAISSWSGS